MGKDGGTKKKKGKQEETGNRISWKKKTAHLVKRFVFGTRYRCTKGYSGTSDEGGRGFSSKGQLEERPTRKI